MGDRWEESSAKDNDSEDSRPCSQHFVLGDFQASVIMW